MPHRVLVLGGYGVFGGGVSRRLVRDGFEVMVAGRSIERAEAFCRDLPGAVPCAVDRAADPAAALERHRPWAVVDAAGPFQSSDQRLPQACAEAGVHYVDLADSPAFVSAAGLMDSAARSAGVSVRSGASSVPALSGAVVRDLAAGLDRATAVEMSISASNQATVGPSVISAILSYVGRPMRLWRGQRWTTGYGWQELRRER